ncbi:hypothetical protein K501DRAFT_215748 [Backusella circina FSU 941]|nr:hypothetical protein K501DRAFT_215748 [Backusella circina FSU 941]
MSSLASLISSVKANTAGNSLVQKNLSLKRKATTASKPAAAPKKIKKITKQEGPQVTVFDGSALHKKPTLEDKASKKQFLSSRISSGEEPINVNTNKQKPTAKDAEEEMENAKKDVELKQLLATSHLLEELERDEMTSRERRRHTMNKLETLGVKATPADKMPLALKLKVNQARQTESEKKLQDAKDLGIYDKSLKHLYVKKQVKKRDRNPGITNGVGRLKGATLTLNSKEIDRIKKQNTKPKFNAKGGRRK